MSQIARFPGDARHADRLYGIYETDPSRRGWVEMDRGPIYGPRPVMLAFLENERGTHPTWEVRLLPGQEGDGEGAPVVSREEPWGVWVESCERSLFTGWVRDSSGLPAHRPRWLMEAHAFELNRQDPSGPNRYTARPLSWRGQEGE